jgi:hypothetical protein
MRGALNVAQALLPARGAKRRTDSRHPNRIPVAFGDAQTGVSAPHTTAPPPSPNSQFSILNSPAELPR